MNKIRQQSIPLFILWMTTLAGMTNVCAIKILHTPLTHHTGNLSQLSITFFENPQHFLELILVILAYCVGAFMSGRLSMHAHQPTQQQGYLLISCAILLILLQWSQQISVSLYLISLLAGIQNTIMMPYKDMKIRITHMTGYLADLGQYMAHWSKGSHIARDKAIFLFVSILSFVMGGWMGYGLVTYTRTSLYILALLYIVAGKLLIHIARRFKSCHPSLAMSGQEFV